jgi:hypothetical protein
MTSRSAALLSNNLVYSAMTVYTLAFLHMHLRLLGRLKHQIQIRKKLNYEFCSMEKIGRIATAMMVLAFILLFAGVIFRGVSASRVPWKRCMSSLLPVL